MGNLHVYTIRSFEKVVGRVVQLTIRSKFCSVRNGKHHVQLLMLPSSETTEIEEGVSRTTILYSGNTRTIVSTNGNVLCHHS